MSQHVGNISYIGSFVVGLKAAAIMLRFRSARVHRFNLPHRGLAFWQGSTAALTTKHWLVKLLFGEEPSKGMGEDSWEF